MKDLRSPLAKVKGWGVSPDASHHHWVHALTGLALIPMVLWFCFSLMMLPEVTYAVLVSWIASPFNAVMMLLIIIIGFHHAHMGMQVIFEDYIPNHFYRITVILITKFLSYFMMVLGVYSIIKLALGSN